MKAIFKLIASDSLVYGVGSALNGLAGILLIPVLVKSLHAAEYGRYAIAEMFIAGLVVLLGMGFGAAFPSHYFNQPVECRKNVAVAAFALFLSIATLASFTFISCLYAYGPVVVAQLPRDMYPLVAVIALLEVAWAALALLLRAESRPWRFVLMSFLQFALSLAITIILIKRYDVREEAILLGRLFATASVVMLSLHLLRGWRPPLEWGEALSLMRSGLMVIPATVSAVWVAMSPRYFLESASTLSDVGIYAMSAKIAGLLSLFLVQPFAMTWNTMLYRIHDGPRAKIVYARALTYYWIAGLLGAFCLCLVAPLIGVFLGSNEFQIAPEVISIASLAVVASGLMYLVNLGPHLKKRLFAPVPIFVAGALIAFLIGGKLTVWFGVVGAAASLVVVYILQAFALGYVSGRIYPVHWEWVRLLKVSIVLPGIYYLYSKLNLSSWASLILPFAYVVTSLLALAWLNFFKSDELSAMLSLRKKNRGHR
jgi:O-antigen/teichoic acid export membrane protein